MSKVFALPDIDLRKTAMLLDVDGTILDLAATPRDVFVPATLRQTLQRLRDETAGALAFVSGRSISDLDRIFAPLRLPAVGGHGAEVRTEAESGPDQSRRPPLDLDLRRALAAIADDHPGILVEDKGYSLALHYRLAPDLENYVTTSAAQACARSPMTPVELLPGKSMLEIKQAGFNKATGVRELMTHPPFVNRRPIFIGDDVTDENVFAIMPEFDGIAIAVGERFSGAPNHMQRPADVRCWLDRLSTTAVLAESGAR